MLKPVALAALLRVYGLNGGGVCVWLPQRGSLCGADAVLVKQYIQSCKLLEQQEIGIWHVRVLDMQANHE